MNYEELKEKIEKILTLEGIGLNVFFLLKAGQESNLKRADIIEDVKTNLIDAYKVSLKQIIENEDLSLINLSAADDRQSALYLYDLEVQPNIFDNFNKINNYEDNDDIDTFTFETDKLTNLEGYYVLFGDHEHNIIIYRKQMPINLFKQGKIYLVKGHDTQFDKIDKEFLRVDTKIDIMNISSSIIINNIAILERHYEFKDIIENEANTTLTNISSIDILENIEVLEERVNDVKFARKLSKISSSSPVFSLPAAHIIQFVKDHDILGNEFRYNQTNNKIVLDTKKSQNYFLKLMNDDFLHSQLTNYDYMTPAKDRLQGEN